MIRWSLSAELLCIIILVLLMFSSHGQKQAPTRRQRVYQACLLLSLDSILLNILCVFTIGGTIVVPLWLNVLLNSLYFFISVLMCSVMAAYLFSLILEHAYSDRTLRRAIVFVAVLTLFFAAAVLWNLRSGILFFFDEQGAYRRGPLNALGYGILAVELAALMVCYLRNRPSVSRSMVHVMRTLPPLVVLMIIFQRLYPEILLNGAIVTMADLILYISFQSRLVEQDSLTGVGNRNSFCNELSLRLASRQRFQVILLGLQQFSDINRRFGHRMGDSFLYEVARQLERLFPRGRVFRFGNVEFALLLPYPDADGAARLQTIRNHFAEPLSLGAAQAVLTVRLADLLCAGEHWTVGRLLEALEYSLDLARKGDGEPVRFQGQAAQMLQRRKDLVSLMRQSLQERRFQVWYQPVWSTAAGAFTSAEALLRLSSPEGEPIPPPSSFPWQRSPVSSTS
ncbi:diguanylate cyclase domain-containing protein [Intestinimonas timonensis]|uniref:diguanylate cyclase domain-containing protein n=1 Tax=Intestinimonas timonensis TaxID=1689270 RepID=UPI00103209DB|nr:diguanylate cyclase [Intestinimonas timonensis]